MLYRGANFVPIAVPCFCLSVFFPNVNMLFFNTTSAKSIMVSVETYFSFPVSSLFVNADRPSSCGKIFHKILPLELVVVNDGPEMRKYFQDSNHY